MSVGVGEGDWEPRRAEKGTRGAGRGLRVVGRGVGVVGRWSGVAAGEGKAGARGGLGGWSIDNGSLITLEHVS